MLKRLLFDNLFAKILALVVSVLLWFYVTEKQTFQETMAVPLHLENIPEELILLGDTPANVRIVLQGQGHFLRHRVRGLHLTLDMSGAEKGRYIRRLTPADVSIPLEEAVEVLEIVTPQLLTADLDQLTVKSVPVIPATEHSPASGYARVGSPVVNPERVAIRGAESIVAGVSSLRTEPISLRGATRMVVARASVDLGGLERVQCEPGQVAVALPVEKIETLSLANIDVVVETDTTRWRIRWQPEEVEIVLEGPVSFLVGVRDVPPVMRIPASPLGAGRYFFDLTIDVETGVRLVSREPEPSVADSSDTTGIVGPTLPVEPIHLGVAMDLPEGVSVTRVTPDRFHIVVEDVSNASGEEGELILPAS